MSLVIKAARAASQGTIPSMGRGDPGLFGGLFGALKGFVTGGPAAAISQGISGFRGRRPTSSVPTGPIGFTSGAGGRRTVQVNAPGFLSEIQRRVPGGATGLVSVACPSGFHPNKSSYFLMDGSHVEEGSRCVKNRRRNPLNPRALSRSIGRIKGAKRASKLLSSITIRDPNAHHHHRKKK